MRGVTFGGKHSFDDFGLILSRKTVPLPAPKVITVDVKGADGSLDLSTVLTGGDVKYANRTLGFDFTAMGDWRSVIAAFAAYVHGKHTNVILDTDPTHYFTGRCSVTGIEEKKAIAELTVEVDAEPWRYEVSETVITEAVTTETTLTVANLRKWVVPQITVSAPIQLTYGGVLYQLQAGTSIIPEVILREGDSLLTFTGAADVELRFRKGAL